MAIGKRNSGGEILPRLKFDARYGTIYTQDRTFENGEWQPSQRDIKVADFCAIFDLETLEIVWADFSPGRAPDIVAVPAGQDPGDAPSEKHKQGVRLRVKMSDDCGGGVRECINLSVGFWRSIDALHDTFLREKPDHPGKLPIVSIAEMVETRTRQGSTFAPEFVIKGWIVRPADLPATAPKPATKKTTTAVPESKPKTIDPNDPCNDPLPRFGS